MRGVGGAFMTKKLGLKGVVAAAMAIATLSCGSDLAKSSAPVELVVSNSQTLQRIDLAGGTGCNQSVGTIQMQARLKNPSTVNQSFNDVRITRYRVSYIRTDGGKQVPAPIVRSMDSLLTAGGGSTSLSNFLVLSSDALTQAPFVALLPVNGGRDPDTKRATITMDVIVEVFGQTLAGESVTGRTRFPLDFCYNCNGCS